MNTPNKEDWIKRLAGLEVPNPSAFVNMSLIDKHRLIDQTYHEFVDLGEGEEFAYELGQLDSTPTPADIANWEGGLIRMKKEIEWWQTNVLQREDLPESIRRMLDRERILLKMIQKKNKVESLIEDAKHTMEERNHPERKFDRLLEALELNLKSLEEFETSTDIGKRALETKIEELKERRAELVKAKFKVKRKERVSDPSQPTQHLLEAQFADYVHARQKLLNMEPPRPEEVEQAIKELDEKIENVKAQL